jgi:hypothetical protein
MEALILTSAHVQVVTSWLEKRQVQDIPQHESLNQMADGA